MQRTARFVIAVLAALVLLVGTAPVQVHPSASNVQRQMAGPDWPEGG